MQKGYKVSKINLAAFLLSLVFSWYNCLNSIVKLIILIHVCECTNMQLINAILRHGLSPLIVLNYVFLGLIKGKLRSWTTIYVKIRKQAKITRLSLFSIWESVSI